MNFNKLNIGFIVLDFFQKEHKNTSFSAINSILGELCGICSFFENESEFLEFKQQIEISVSVVCEPDRSEYGDFQTNDTLSFAVCQHLTTKNIEPQILIEPTCGKGSFILSSIKTFETLQYIFGIEIYKPYLWELKFSILEYFLQNPQVHKPIIQFYNSDIFDFDFQLIKKQISNQELLVIGNPPWVTNSMLSTLNSDNLPKKSNFKQLKGIDAITGKGNFDIGEFISKMMLDNFAKFDGYFAFLVKNSVIKNIVHEQKRNKYSISKIEKYNINALKEFGAAVDAGLILCRLNSQSEYTANEFDFYSLKKQTTFGWLNDKFASDIEKYAVYQNFEGICPFEWRQGIKHDCARIMEIEKVNGHFVNANHEEFDLENDLVYGLLKSSDLKGETVRISRKYTIVTQQRIGQETKQILEKLPKTKHYLDSHKDFFLQRKSSIYVGKPMFSIFGVGDYSFKPYKVAISGLYKQTLFTLVESENDKTLMLDDTCYFIGFDNLAFAKITQFLLNKKETQNFIQSFIFTDTKRAITKDLLMRIDLKGIAKTVSYEELNSIIKIEDWNNYLKQFEQKKQQQLNIFDELEPSNTIRKGTKITN